MTTSTDQTLSESKFDISFIIHYRKDVEDRLNNLKVSLKYIRNSFPDCEIILINDSPTFDQELLPLATTFKIKLLHCINEDEFKKAYCFNFGASVAKSEVYCFWDVDVLIDSTFIKKSLELIKTNEYDHVYPFNGLFIDIQKDLFQPYVYEYDFDSLNQKWKERDPSLLFASSESPGGCNLISKEAFDRILGYDIRFIGWGFEDTDFMHRSKRINKVLHLPDPHAICWHMHHENALRTKNPHYINNLSIFNQNNNR